MGRQIGLTVIKNAEVKIQDLRTHREVFTEYLRQKNKSYGFENWQDWLHEENIVQCEECRRYGQYGTDIYFVDEVSSSLCEKCEREYCPEKFDDTDEEVSQMNMLQGTEKDITMNGKEETGVTETVAQTPEVVEESIQVVEEETPIVEEDTKEEVQTPEIVGESVEEETLIVEEDAKEEVQIADIEPINEVDAVQDAEDTQDTSEEDVQVVESEEKGNEEKSLSGAAAKFLNVVTITLKRVEEDYEEGKKIFDKRMLDGSIGHAVSWGYDTVVVEKKWNTLRVLDCTLSTGDIPNLCQAVRKLRSRLEEKLTSNSFRSFSSTFAHAVSEAEREAFARLYTNEIRCIKSAMDKYEGAETVVSEVVKDAETPVDAVLLCNENLCSYKMVESKSRISYKDGSGRNVLSILKKWVIFNAPREAFANLIVGRDLIVETGGVLRVQRDNLTVEMIRVYAIWLSLKNKEG